MQSLPTRVQIIYGQCVLLPHHMRHTTCSAGRYAKQQVRVVLRSYPTTKVLQGGSRLSGVYHVYIVVDNLYMAIILLSVIRCNLDCHCSTVSITVSHGTTCMWRSNADVNSECLGAPCSPRQCRDSSALTVNMCTISTEFFGNTSKFKMEKKSRL
jgi:hypothetical protein